MLVPLKVHNVFPKVATSCENMASHRERVMEKTRKFQIGLVYAGLTNLCQHSTTGLAQEA